MEGTFTWHQREVREAEIDLFVEIFKALGFIKLMSRIGIKPRAAIKKRL